MELISWKDEYSVGVNEIDQQHLKLVNLINELYDAMSKGKGKYVLDSVFENLQIYIQDHFKKEERLMAIYAYPDFTRHKEIHNGFVAKVKDMKHRFENGEEMMSIEIVKFLKDWLINHICGTDKEYTDHFRSRGLK